MKQFWSKGAFEGPLLYLCLLKAGLNRSGCLGCSTQVCNLSKGGDCRTAVSSLFLCLTCASLRKPSLVQPGSSFCMYVQWLETVFQYKPTKS